MVGMRLAADVHLRVRCGSASVAGHWLLVTPVNGRTRALAVEPASGHDNGMNRCWAQGPDGRPAACGAVRCGLQLPPDAAGHLPSGAQGLLSHLLALLASHDSRIETTPKSNLFASQRLSWPGIGILHGRRITLCRKHNRTCNSFATYLDGRSTNPFAGDAHS